MTKKEIDEVFTQQYQNYVSNLVRYSRGNLTKNQASELVADSYAKIIRYYEEGKLESIKTPVSYFGQTTYRTYLDLVRKQATTAYQTISTCDLLKELVADESSLEDEIDSQNLLYKVVSYLSTNLTERQFSIFLHNFVYGSTLKQIRQKLKIPAERIKEEIKIIKEVIAKCREGLTQV